MAQVNPTYVNATSAPDPVILGALTRRYGSENVVWPIVLMKDNMTISYLYERTSKSAVNSRSDNRPISSSGVAQYYLHYLADPRVIVPSNPQLEPMISRRYGCSYEYVTGSQYVTVDIDYVWRKGGLWKGMEVTTFWSEFTTQARAEELVRTLNRRASWAGPEGAHALHSIVNAARDLAIDMHMVLINTIGKVGNSLKTDGNVYMVPLSHPQVDRLAERRTPSDGSFGPFGSFLDSL